MGNSVEVMHGQRVLAPYEVCSEQVRLVLQQTVEWFRPFRPLSAGFGTTAQQPPQQDFLLALSFCRAVYGLTFRKGRSGMLRRNNEVKPLAAC
jgi:hypothetical protein